VVFDGHDDERRRILRAALDEVAATGYPDATVAHVLTAAGISRQSFYERFASKRECLREALLVWQAAWLIEVRAAMEVETDPRRAGAAGIAAALRRLAEDPAGGRCVLLERRHVLDADEEAQRTVALADALGTAAGVPDRFAVRFFLAGLEGIVAEELTRDTPDLRALEPELLRLAGLVYA
jgi:AcrR family transcriptional regulator